MEDEAAGVGTELAETTQPGFVNSGPDVTIGSWSHPLKAFKCQADSNLKRPHQERADVLDGSSRPLLALRFCDKIIF